MKRELGISIYPDHSDADRDRTYLEKAAKLGFTHVFMSMLEMQQNKKEMITKFKNIIADARNLGFSVTIDVNPQLFQQLGISYDDLHFFADLGATGIRLDEGFDGLKESLITYNPEKLEIELNMSNDVAYLDNILSYQANRTCLTGGHNFYPQKGSGLPYGYFVKCSERFKKHGIKTAAFITSQDARAQDGGPWNINDGLPTLEMHRDWPIELQAKHLFATGLIDTVTIGNCYASDDELMRLAKLNRDLITLDVSYVSDVNPIEKQILEDNLHFRRGDITAQTIRSAQVRVKYADQPNVPHDNEHQFKRGDVVIGNDHFGRYRNELQIVLEEHLDSRKNLVARIDPQELFLLDYLQPWSKFKFSNPNS